MGFTVANLSGLSRVLLPLHRAQGAATRGYAVSAQSRHPACLHARLVKDNTMSRALCKSRHASNSSFSVQSMPEETRSRRRPRSCRGPGAACRPDGLQAKECPPSTSNAALTDPCHPAASSSLLAVRRARCSSDRSASPGARNGNVLLIGERHQSSTSCLQNGTVALRPHAVPHAADELVWQDLRLTYWVCVLKRSDPSTRHA